MSLLSFGQNYLYEDFSDGEMPPNGWTIDNVEQQWTVNNSNNAGGNFPEARFQWIQQVAVTKLISPQIDLSGLTSIQFQFNHMYDDYEGEGPTIGIATRSGNGIWTSVWEILPTTNVGPEKIEIEITNVDVGQTDFQICFYILGNLFNLDYWYVDGISLFQPIEMDITFLLEGPFVIEQMTNDLNLNEYLPLEQPYSGSPWDYNGTETVSVIPNNSITDWVLVELFTKSLFPQPSFSIKAQKAGFVLQDGSITDLDGVTKMSLQFPESESIYLRVRHRNHLSLMSSGILEPQNGICIYDFTSGAEMAVDGHFVMRELSEGKWGVLSGNGNADGQINNNDKNEIWLSQMNSSGYILGDFNMDGEVNEYDIEGFWGMNSGKGGKIYNTATNPFICGELLFDDRDGQYYNTVQIGEQCWMEENLNFETGTSWCYYNSTAYCDEFGRLYNWETIMNGSPQSDKVPSGVQGICPEAWHLPSDGEWCILTQFIDQTIDCETTGYNGTDGGIKMKSTVGWSSGGNGTNQSGFNALPAGSMGIYHFDDIYLFANFWSTTEDDPDYAWIIKLNYGLPTIGHYFSSKYRGYSARCIMDE